jgi:hypothetical protein
LIFRVSIGASRSAVSQFFKVLGLDVVEDEPSGMTRAGDMDQEPVQRPVGAEQHQIAVVPEIAVQTLVVRRQARNLETVADAVVGKAGGDDTVGRISEQVFNIAPFDAGRHGPGLEGGKIQLSHHDMLLALGPVGDQHHPGALGDAHDVVQLAPFIAPHPAQQLPFVLARRTGIEGEHRLPLVAVQAEHRDAILRDPGIGRPLPELDRRRKTGVDVDPEQPKPVLHRVPALHEDGVRVALQLVDHRGQVEDPVSGGRVRDEGKRRLGAVCADEHQPGHRHREDLVVAHDPGRLAVRRLVELQGDHQPAFVGPVDADDVVVADNDLVWRRLGIIRCQEVDQGGTFSTHIAGAKYSQARAVGRHRGADGDRRLQQLVQSRRPGGRRRLSQGGFRRYGGRGRKQTSRHQAATR